MPIIVPATGPTFASLQTEFYERGPEYLEDDTAGQTRAKGWLNVAYHDICERYPWPFLRITVDDTAPIPLTDVRKVTSVFDITAGYPLWFLENVEDLSVLGFNPTLTGTPTHAYLDQDTLNVWPLNTTDDLKIRYVALEDDLVADGDVPVIPARFTSTIVDGALMWSQKDNDAYGKYQSLSQIYEQSISLMAQSLMYRNGANPEVQRMFMSHEGSW